MRRERNEPTEQEIHDYWKEIFDRRTKDKDLLQRDIWRLCAALEGEFYMHMFCNLSSNSIYSLPTILDFSDSKRPYGNKDVPASILFRLGWDEKGYLSWRLPEFVRDKCEQLHHEVIRNMETEQEIFHDIFYAMKENIPSIQERLLSMKLDKPKRYDEEE